MVIASSPSKANLPPQNFICQVDSVSLYGSLPFSLGTKAMQNLYYISNRRHTQVICQDSKGTCNWRLYHSAVKMFISLEDARKFSEPPKEEGFLQGAQWDSEQFQVHKVFGAIMPWCYGTSIYNTLPPIDTNRVFLHDNTGGTPNVLRSSTQKR